MKLDFSVLSEGELIRSYSKKKIKIQYVEWCQVKYY